MKKKKLFKDDFFVPIEGELYNSLEDGGMTPVMWCVYSMLLRQVDFETGIWRGTAYRIQHAWNFQIPERTVQAALKRLCESGRLKSFHVKGDKKDYPVAIHGYKIRYGKWAGHLMDAGATANPKSPVYVRPENGQDSPQDDRIVTAATPQDDRRNTAARPYANARNTPDVPDSPDVLEIPESTKPSNHSTDGWMAGRIALIFSKAAGNIVGTTAKERGELAMAVAKYRALPVLLAAYHYPERPLGLGGLERPVTRFLQELAPAIEVARQNVLESTHRPEVRETVSELVGEHRLKPTEPLVSELCTLAELHSNLYGEDWYNYDAVRDYLQNAPPETMAVAA
jgi:hypothetical protein